MSTDPLPRAVDLLRYASDIEAAGDDLKLVDPIRQIAQTESCLSDVRQCQDTIQALNELLASPRGDGSQKKATTENALLATALLLYGRATSTNGDHGERGPSDITRQLTSIQKIDHDQLLAVRNRAIAHVYPGEIMTDIVWHETAAMLVEVEGGWRPVASSIRVQLDRRVLACLMRQAPVAFQIIRDRLHKRYTKLAGRMKKVVDATHFGDIISGYPMNSVEFFGSIEAARAALGSHQQEHATGFTVRKRTPIEA